MTKIKTLKSWNEDHTKRVPIAPRTHVKAVFDDNGNTLDSLMAVQDEKLSELGSEVGLAKSTTSHFVDIPFSNNHNRIYVEITDTIRKNAKYYVFGFKNKTDNDKLGHVMFGNGVCFTLSNNYEFIRIYEQGETETEFDWSYVFQPIQHGVIDKNDVEVGYTTDTYDLTEFTNDLFPLKKGELIEVTLNSYNGSNPVYAFGMITTSPQVYDTFSSNLKVGESVKFVTEKDYETLRIFKNDTEPINVTVTKKSGKVFAEIEWLHKKLNTVDNIDRLFKINENPLDTISMIPGYGSIIHEWGFIGDSLSSGCTECYKNGNKIYLDLFDYSWGQRLCKLLGTNGFNFSYSGQQAKSWCLGWTEIQTTSKPPTTTTTPEDRIWDGESVGVSGRGAKYNPKQGYIIALGVNDSGRHEYPLGSIDDIDLNNYQNNNDSFYGYYAGIIQRLRSVAPNAYIFCVTSLENNDYDAAIRTIVPMFQRCYLIDLSYGVNYGSEFRERYYLGGHMNAAGYQYTAYVMNTYIDWIIRNNFSDFKDASLVNTEYTMNQ